VISSPKLRRPTIFVRLLVSKRMRLRPSSFRIWARYRSLSGPGEDEPLVRLDSIEPLVLEVVGLHLV
jgi:hypothetical protein